MNLTVKHADGEQLLPASDAYWQASASRLIGDTLQFRFVVLRHEEADVMRGKLGQSFLDQYIENSRQELERWKYRGLN